MVKAMKAGSVVVDLAAETGGNVEGAKPGEIVEVNGVRLWGGKDVPSQLPFHASQLFSRNCLNLLMLMIKTEEGNTSIALDFEDEIIAGSAITHAGEIRHEGARNAITGAGKN